jgi:glycerate kinase
LRVLIVADKFKGTLTAEQAAAAIAHGWSSIRREDIVETLPMADGGDGFGAVLGHLLDAEPRSCATVDCAGRARNATWWFAPRTKTAIIEAAEVNGLRLLPPGRYHPFNLDTTGLGALLRAAISAEANRIFVGLGGSATNDGGFGLARSIGWVFLDSNGNELRRWTALTNLVRLDPPLHGILTGQELVIAVDVTNKLLGPRGATRIYGPQKGLRDAELEQSEACLSQLASVSGATCERDYAAEAGAGAAGGLGFAMRAFCGGQFRPGARVFAELADLERRITAAQLVITAEGCFDEQSLMGKGVGHVAELAALAQRPCLCLPAVSRIDPRCLPWSQFEVHSIVPTIADVTHAKRYTTDCLRQLAARVAALR